MTSESDRIRENKPAPNTEGESNKQPGHPEVPVPLTPTPKSEFQPPKSHCEITCKAEKDWWDKAKPFVEIGGAILLAIYTAYTIKMYCANKKAANAAQSAAETARQTFVDGQTSFRDDHRAWLAVTLFNVESYDPNDVRIPFKIRLNLHNSGKTPVVNMHAGVRFAFSSTVVDALPEQYYEAVEKELQQTKGRTSVAPDGNMNAFGDDTKGADVRKHYSTIRAGKEFVYLYGVIDYFDAYKRPHTTRLCLYMVNPVMKDLALCQEGNEMN